MTVKNVYSDWTRNIIQSATVRSLDPEAIRSVRATHQNAFPNREDYSELSDIDFFNKVGLFKRGMVTNAAMILLGKASEHVLDTRVAVRWSLLDVDGMTVDSRVFEGSMVLAVRKAASIISNSSVRVGEGEDSKVVSTYRIATLTEAMFNALAFQDYSLGGVIDVVERENESVSVLSRGGFPDLIPENMVTGRQAPRIPRNEFLVQSMVNLGLVPGAGSGIRNMFLNQIYRHFPLPRFDITPDSVTVTIPGRRTGAFVRALDMNEDMELADIMDLNRIDSGRFVPEKRLRSLERRDLAVINGGVPCINIGQAGSLHRFHKGSDQDAVLRFLEENGSVSRSDVAEVLRLRDKKGLTDDQLLVKATNVIQNLRKDGRIVKSDGSTRSARYVISKRS